MTTRGVHGIHITLLLLVSYLVLFHGLGAYSLKEPDEGRYAEIAREMVELQDYVVPRLNYTRYFEKPPLFYWTVAFSFKAFGFSEVSARLTSALAALLSAGSVYLAALRWFGRGTAVLSTLILLTSFGFFTMARIVTIDMLFSALLFITLLLFSEYYRTKRQGFINAAYAVLGLATLAKGPVALLLLGLTIFIFLLSQKNLAFLKELRWVRGIFIYAAIVLPWFLIIAAREKEFLYFFFVDQNLLRFLTTRHKREGSYFYFVPVLFGGMFPWSLFIPRAILSAWAVTGLKLLIIWSGVAFAFFSISSSKLPAYVLPMLPALSIILGYLFAQKWSTPLTPRSEALVYQGILSILAVSSFILLSRDSTALPLMDLSGSALLLQHVRRTCIGAAIVLLALSLLPFLMALRTFKALFFLSSVVPLVFVTALYLNVDIIDRLNTTKVLARVINEQRVSGDYLANYGSFEETLPYYTRSPVVIVGYRGELEMGSRYPDSSPYFMTHEAFGRLFDSTNRVFCVVKQSRLPALQSQIRGTVHILARENEKFLITNR
jgi:4-amino-4-deoxy-L-arabinose transferase-like glycosyltransferase